MRRNHNIIRLLGLALLGVLLQACSTEEFKPAPNSDKDFDVRIVARPKGFETINVGTKSNKTDEEKTVTNMTMFILANDNTVAYRQFIGTSSPLFTIDRKDLAETHPGKQFDKAKIYVLANYPDDASEGVEDLDDIKALFYELSDIGIPEGGFPMIGSNDNIDLDPDGTLPPGKVIDVTLYCLYAKVVFDIAVDPSQTSENQQKFTMDACTVHNIPSKIALGEPGALSQTTYVTSILKDATDNTKNRTFTINQSSWSTNVARESGSSISFTFYIPEHKVIPDTKAENYVYPWGTGIARYDENGASAPWAIDYRQHYKPDLLGSQANLATYVELHGTYTDHNATDHVITYKIYLGEDNYSNFFIGRDKQLNNHIKIKGATNSSSVNPNTISYDHRVDIQATQFKFSLERETMLDSHWEIRPIRIAINRTEYPDAKIKVQILEPETSDWIRLEMPTNPTGTDYCNAGNDPTADAYLAYGKRKYFTTNLVTELAANTSYELTPSTPSTTTVQVLPNGETEYCIWAYIDENHSLAGIPADGGCTSRNAIVRCKFWQDGDESNTSVSNYIQEDYNFSQRSLYRINYDGRPYYIEDYEEYLYNFDSREPYNTTDGMEWGLDGVQLSNTYDALFVNGINILGYNTGNIVMDWLKDEYDPKYDFYITSAEALNGRVTYRQYSGHTFSQEIVTKAGIGSRPSNEQVESAVEYCYNKNKRNSSTGKVDNQSWYLPAIDEIEDICMGGYSYFTVFQNKYYWSSQPAYLVYDYSYSGLSSDEGQFYQEDSYRARATKVDNNFNTVESGATVAATKVDMKLTNPGLFQFDVDPTTSPTGATAEQIAAGRGPGNRPRTGGGDAINRIRCVYDASNMIHNITLGYESTSNPQEGWSYTNFTRNNGAKNSGTYSGRTSAQNSSMQYQTKMVNPENLSFYVRTSNTSTAGYWYVDYSYDNSNWTNILEEASNTNQNTWRQITVDLSSYSNIYVRIRHSYSTNLNTNTRYIDDIVLNYTD